MDGGCWADWLLTVVNALYFTLPLTTGVVTGLLRGTISTGLSTRRTLLVRLGIGLLGAGIAVVTFKFYGYYWDYHSGWWYEQSLMDRFMKEIREVVIALPVLMAVLTSAASFLVFGRWQLLRIS